MWNAWRFFVRGRAKKNQRFKSYQRIIIVVMFENLALFIAGQEWIILIVVAVVLIFGARKIPELARTFGKAKGEFEKGKIEGEKELKKYKDKKP